jgi:hypothetical protein
MAYFQFIGLRGVELLSRCLCCSSRTSCSEKGGVMSGVKGLMGWEAR